jgi:hypothetical protein
MVAPDIVGVAISAGRVEYGRQEPYAQRPKDRVVDPVLHRFVLHGGKLIGSMVGTKGDLLCTMDRVVGERLDAA